MFRVSFIDEKNNLAHKSFDSVSAAYKWVDNNAGITPLKLLVWDDSIDCFATFREF